MVTLQQSETYMARQRVQKYVGENRHVRGVSGLARAKYGSFNATGAVIRRSALGRIILRSSFSRPGKGALVREILTIMA